MRLVADRFFGLRNVRPPYQSAQVFANFTNSRGSRDFAERKPFSFVKLKNWRSHGTENPEDLFSHLLPLELEEPVRLEMTEQLNQLSTRAISARVACVGNIIAQRTHLRREMYRMENKKEALTKTSAKGIAELSQG